MEIAFVTRLVVDKPKTKSSLGNIPISSNLILILIISMHLSIQSIYVVSNINIDFIVFLIYV